MFSTTTTTLVFITLVSLLPTFSFSAVDTFVYGGCSQSKYFPGSPYESNVNSLLTSFVNSASLYTYNNFTFNGISGDTSSVYGLYQCRGDLSSSSGECTRCVARAVSRLGSLCVGASGGALQLEGCFVKYDNTTFLGVEDKMVVVRRCGPPDGYISNESTRRDSVLSYLAASNGGSYRIGVSGQLQGVAQCTGDLSVTECQDCLMEAIGRLKSDCGLAAWGDVYLAKCYARYSARGDHSRANGYGGNRNNDDEDEIQKTLAIIVGLIAGVTLLVVFLSFMAKSCERIKGGK